MVHFREPRGACRCSGPQKPETQAPCWKITACNAEIVVLEPPSDETKLLLLLKSQGTLYRCGYCPKKRREVQSVGCGIPIPPGSPMRPKLDVVVPLLLGAALVVSLFPFIALSQRSGTQTGKVVVTARRSPVPFSMQSRSSHRYAHVVVIGNEKYVDGALVMGWTLAKHGGDADRVCLVTAGQVSSENLARLRRTGWTAVREVYPAGRLAPRAFWKDSFTKLHIFNLTEYQKVAYWDADMVVTGDASAIFDTHVPNGTVAAIGNNPKKGKPYFQTGMMVFHPDPSMCALVWNTFAAGVRSGRYNEYNARDGMLLRDLFSRGYVLLPKKFSRNLDPRKPLKGVVGVHYRGGWKPWFDLRAPVKKRLPGDEDTKKDFGYPYLRWWKEYEELIQGEGEDGRWEADQSVENEMLCLKGGVMGRPGVDTHVWMLRGTKSAYVQPLSREVECRRNRTYSGLYLSLSSKGASCVDACKPLTCHQPSFNTTLLNSCATLQALGCMSTRCTPGIYTKRRPGSIYPALVSGILYPKSGGEEQESDGKELHCVVNLLLDQRGLPACDAADHMARRVCPCRLGTNDDVSPVPWNGIIPNSP